MKKTRVFYLSLIIALGLTVGGAAITSSSYYDGSLGAVNLTYQPNIAFDATTNKIYQGTGMSGSYPNTSVVKTGLGNDVKLEYKYVTNDGWQGLAEYGYIKNIDPITSIKSITMNFSENTNTGLVVYYSIFPDFRDNKRVEFNKDKTITFNLNDTEAHYFKLTTYNYREGFKDVLTIDSMIIDFYCDENHHYLDAKTYTPELGTVSQSGYYMAGREIKVHAIPDVGVEFEGWFEAGGLEPLTLNEEYSFIMPNSDYTLVARFKELKIRLGSYPQSRVIDQDLVNQLKKKVNENGWIPYTKYYVNYEGSWEYDQYNGFSHYQDMTYNMEKYRCVKLGFEINYVHAGSLLFFKYEPIVWYPLGNEGLYLSLNAIEGSQHFYHNDAVPSGITIYPNNYEHSDIRKFLNDKFYNFAFSKDEQAKIVQTTIKNDLSSTLDKSNSYLCNDTSDKVFLLCTQDVCNANYGFVTKEDRICYATEYSSFMENELYGHNRCYWTTRTPISYGGADNWLVQYDGNLNTASVDSTTKGIRPAIYYRA